MEEADIQKRVSDLEQEVSALKSTLKADPKQQSLAARSQNLARFLVSNWVLLSFLSVLVTAGYVKYKFGIDYFENYRNTATIKELSKFYEKMGDGMMAKSEWVAAEKSYHDALQVNPNNSAAAFGIAKAQVFQPVPGEKTWAPEVVDARLDYLQSRFPDDYQIYFLKAMRYELMGENEKAVPWLQKCVDKKPNFTGCYIELGFIDVGRSKVAEAKANFEEAVRIDPNSATAINDLAACHFLLSDFSGAAKGFQESYQISPQALTALNIGEADWFAGDFASALEIHQMAANYMDGAHDANDRYIGSEWREPYFPIRVGDTETIKRSAPVEDVEVKRAIFHFALSTDHALLEEWDAADEEFAAALKHQPRAEHRHLIQNRMQSVENMAQISAATRIWLDKHRAMLE